MHEHIHFCQTWVKSASQISSGVAVTACPHRPVHYDANASWAVCGGLRAGVRVGTTQGTRLVSATGRLQPRRLRLSQGRHRQGAVHHQERTSDCRRSERRDRACYVERGQRLRGDQRSQYCWYVHIQFVRTGWSGVRWGTRGGDYCSLSACEHIKTWRLCNVVSCKIPSTWHY